MQLLKLTIGDDGESGSVKCECGSSEVRFEIGGMGKRSGTIGYLVCDHCETKYKLAEDGELV